VNHVANKRPGAKRLAMKTLALALVLVLLGLALALSACGTTSATITEPTTAPSQEEAQLVGTWETVSMGTDWVDRLTYEFRPDGTFSYLAKKSGTTTGTEMLSGRFRIDGDGLFLTDVRETWIDPTGSTEYKNRKADDRRVLYSFTDGVLLLNGEAYAKK
jgi:ABC-type transport system substrate-binding protein